MSKVPRIICANDEKNGRLGWRYGYWHAGPRPADADDDWNGEEYLRLKTAEAEKSAAVRGAVEAERAAEWVRRAEWLEHQAERADHKAMATSIPEEVDAWRNMEAACELMARAIRNGETDT